MTTLRMTKGTARRDATDAGPPEGPGRSLHRSAPDRRPALALALTACALGVWLGVTLAAEPLSAGLAELITRVELARIGGRG